MFPPAERTVLRCFVKSKYGEDAGHLVEGIFRLTETLFELDAVQNQRDLYPLGLPDRAVRSGGYVRVVNLLFGKVSTHPNKLLSDARLLDGV